MKKFFIIFFAFILNSNAKSPIYAEEDGNVIIYVEWENANAENSIVMDFQKYYKDCMADETSAIKNENFCVDSITVHLFPFSTECVEYYYGAIEVKDKKGKLYSGDEFVKERYVGEFEYNVKKGDILGYAYDKERAKVIHNYTNRKNCK
jgi:hypothetical protein